MADIVQESGYDRHIRAPLVELLMDARDFPPDDPGQRARGVKDTDGVGKSRVGGAGKNKVRHTELTYASQPLKLGRVKELPRQLIERIVLPESDEAVYRIANPLGARPFWHDKNIT
jgi:hypothetical protein